MIRRVRPSGKLVELEAPDGLHVGGRPRLAGVEPTALQVGIAIQAQEPVWFNDRYPVGIQDAAERPELQLVADGSVLPLWVDLGCASATSVVKQVPGIPIPTVPAHLDKPRPYILWCRLNGDRHGRRAPALGNQSSARVRPSDLLSRCSPAPQLIAHPPSMEACCRPGHVLIRPVLAVRVHGCHRSHLRSSPTPGQVRCATARLLWSAVGWPPALADGVTAVAARRSASSSSTLRG